MKSVKNRIPKRPFFLCLLLAFFFVGLVSAQQGGGNTTYLPLISVPVGDSWPTVAANPQRTSYTPAQVSGPVNLLWYRPIEAYIPQNVQIIAEYGNLYVSTSKGLVVLNATNGELAWRYDTELPLGNSPTVVNNVVYVGGYDRKLHALNAQTGQHLWSFDGAKAGYATNPLVVDGKVYVGNRDGTMYAIGAHGSAQQGQLIWEYETDGPILLTAAFNNNTVYFASNDMFAYALNANTGALVWKSDKLPGAQYQSYWPVIHNGTVIFSAAHGYREDRAPGTRSVPHPSGGIFGTYRQMQLSDIFPEGAQTFDDPAPPQSWAHGFPAVDGHRITEYLENNPQPDTYKHKPWRRVFVSLNQSNGQEFTFDSDQDGFPEYIPAAYWGTGSGNRYPPVVGAMASCILATATTAAQMPKGASPVGI
ncbi:MAG: PQQ-binding-like beta-propeller repeat protein [Anaerolineae bacterium]|nr:PQQ-binding-like beta-propeller repeat protein [Anaerolineae bacterium]